MTNARTPIVSDPEPATKLARANSKGVRSRRALAGREAGDRPPDQLGWALHQVRAGVDAVALGRAQHDYGGGGGCSAASFEFESC